jgi:hypothetical protein
VADLTRTYPTRNERLEQAQAARQTALNPTTRHWARCFLSAASLTQNNTPTIARQIARARRKALQTTHNLKNALNHADFTAKSVDSQNQ